MADLVTLAEAKTHLDIASTDTAHDTRLNQLIPQISEIVRQYCRDDFQNISRTEYFDGGQRALYVRYRPITSITSVKINEVALVENTDFVVYYDQGRIEPLINRFSYARDVWWGGSKKAIEVKYNGGASADNDVKFAVLEWLAVLSGLKKKTYTTGEGIEATVTLTTIPEDIRLILLRRRKGRL